MRETNFIKQNKTKWAEFEKELEKAEKDADKTSSLYSTHRRSFIRSNIL